MKTVFSYLGALLMILSGISVNFDFHLCQGKVKSLGIFAEANECDMALSQYTCSKTGKQGWNKTNCCKDVNLAYHSSDFDQNNNIQIPVDVQRPDYISRRVLHCVDVEFISVKKYVDYPPPDPAPVEVYKILETYRI